MVLPKKIQSEIDTENVYFFSHLFENFLTGMKNLDSLILAHNQLSKVPANVFRHLPLLNSLELEGNQITYIDKDAFAGLEGECNLANDKRPKHKVPEKILSKRFKCTSLRNIENYGVSKQ